MKVASLFPRCYRLLAENFCENTAKKEYLENLETYFIEKGFSQRWNLPPQFFENAEDFSSLSLVSWAEETDLDDVKPLSAIKLSEFNDYMRSKNRLDIHASDYDPDSSCGVYHNNKLTGLHLVLKGEKYYNPAYYFADSREDEDKLFLFAVQEIANNMSVNDNIALVCLERDTARFLLKVFENKDQYYTYALGGETENILQNLEDEE